MPSLPIDLDAARRERLLALARDAIRAALEEAPLPAADAQLLAGLPGQPLACFVTLTQGGRLRGCIGTLEPQDPLPLAVARNAVSAALRDPRFPPLQPDELAATRISISVLTPSQPLPAASEAELLAALVPGQDGLIIEDGPHQATFLPQVWEQLPAPRDFLRHLKAKAGLAADAWSPRMRCWRYRTLSFAELG